MSEVSGVVYGLYCTCHPESGFRYIGITTRGMRERWIGHKSDMKRYPDWPVSRWKSKHGIENIRHKILMECPTVGLLQSAEVDTIELFRGKGQADLNVQAGGVLARYGLTHSPETRAKMSASQSRRIAEGRGARGRGWTTGEIESSRARMTEMWRNGTMNNSGESNGSAKLTWALVEEIRAQYPRLSRIELAGKYGIEKSTMGDVLQGRSWRLPV